MRVLYPHYLLARKKPCPVPIGPIGNAGLAAAILLHVPSPVKQVSGVEYPLMPLLLLGDGLSPQALARLGEPGVQLGQLSGGARLHVSEELVEFELRPDEGSVFSLFVY